ncbi:hypothetical protein BDW22DRAFT_975945 [Trametopsis cervina]|nr:hypothetical protein BDW22DRAFT_975945 [Trametopsis cervina]
MGVRIPLVRCTTLTRLQLIIIPVRFLITSSATSQVEHTGRHPMTNASFCHDASAPNPCSTAHESPRSSSHQSRPQPGSHRSYPASDIFLLLLPFQPALELMHVFKAPVLPIPLTPSTTLSNAAACFTRMLRLLENDIVRAPISHPFRTASRRVQPARANGLSLGEILTATHHLPPATPTM